MNLKARNCVALLALMVTVRLVQASPPQVAPGDAAEAVKAAEDWRQGVAHAR